MYNHQGVKVRLTRITAQTHGLKFSTLCKNSRIQCLSIKVHFKKKLAMAYFRGESYATTTAVVLNAELVLPMIVWPLATLKAIRESPLVHATGYGSLQCHCIRRLVQALGKR